MGSYTNMFKYKKVTTTNLWITFIIILNNLKLAYDLFLYLNI